MQSKSAPRLINRTHRYKSVAAVTTANTLTKIGTFDVSGVDFLYMAITVATEALNDFQVKSSGVPEGAILGLTPTLIDLKARITDYETTALQTAATGTHAARYFVRGLATVEIHAKSALGTATVALEAGAD